LRQLGATYNRLSRYEVALEHLQQALTRFRQAGDLIGEALTLTSLGIADYRMGNHKHALDDHLQSIDLARHLVAVRGEPVNLTRSEFQVLRLLAENPGQVFSRLEIMEELWQSEFSGDVRACDVHISNLRQKIERDPQEPELVVTVRGVGYKLAEAVG
jgi:DNA-binding response OmpR family regulator